MCRKRNCSDDEDDDDDNRVVLLLLLPSPFIIITSIFRPCFMGKQGGKHLHNTIDRTPRRTLVFHRTISHRVGAASGKKRILSYRAPYFLAISITPRSNVHRLSSTTVGQQTQRCDCGVVRQSVYNVRPGQGRRTTTTGTTQPTTSICSQSCNKFGDVSLSFPPLQPLLTKLSAFASALLCYPGAVFWVSRSPFSHSLSSSDFAVRFVALISYPSCR